MGKQMGRHGKWGMPAFVDGEPYLGSGLENKGGIKNKHKCFNKGDGT